MVYVDQLTQYYKSCYTGTNPKQAIRVGNKNNHYWCHLVADSLEELNKFAIKIDLKLIWLQKDHYDLTPTRRIMAIKNGAIEITRKQLVAILRKYRHKLT
jgi:hypothetical protein